MHIYNISNAVFISFKLILIYCPVIYNILMTTTIEANLYYGG